MDLVFACKYPFTEEGRKAVAENGIQINEVIAEKALKRVVAALKNEARICRPVHISDQLEEIGSYGGARMLLAHLGNRFLINKFAVSEAKKAHEIMRGESRENIEKLQGELGIVPCAHEGRTALPVATYLKFAPKSKDYRLVRRSVKAGFVEVEGREVLRLMEEAVKMRVGEIGRLKGAPEVVKKYSDSLMKLVPRAAPMKMSFREGDNPPCIEKLLNIAKKHENLGHQGRWSLAVYLINRGVEYEKILRIFSNFPDYEEKIAAYQIKHAIKRGYGMPSCGMMLSYGLCVADCGIKSPLGWKGWKKGKGR